MSRELKILQAYFSFLIYIYIYIYRERERGCVSTTVQMHLVDANKTHWEKTRWELHKNTTSYFEQILRATSHKTAGAWSHTSHLTNRPSKTNMTCGTLLEKQEWIHKCHSSMEPFTWAYQCWMTTKNLNTAVRIGHKM